MDFDTILSDVGGFGKYQKIVLFCFLLPGLLSSAFHDVSLMFMQSIPDHWCRIPELENITNRNSVRNLSIPLEERNGRLEFSQCLMYDKNYTSEDLLQEGIQRNARIIPCKNGWIYDEFDPTLSVVMKWDLVCDKDIAVSVVWSLTTAIGLIGNAIFGYIQDRFGRKPSYCIYLAIQICFGFAAAAANNFYLWAFFRMGIGFTIPAIVGTPSILCVELISPRYRATANILATASYSMGLMAISVVAWALQNWRLLQLAIALPFLPILFCYRLIPESPQWLVSQGRLKEADGIFNKMAKINGRKNLPLSDISKLLEQQEGKQEKEEASRAKYNMLHLFKYKNMRAKTLTLTFLWVTTTIVYAGLSQYTPHLGGNVHITFLWAAAIELIGYFMIWPVMHRWGRKKGLFVSMIIGGVSCLATYFANDNYVASLILYAIGKFGTAGPLLLLSLIISEMYPTVIRGTGSSFTYIFGTLGNIFVPLMNYLGTQIPALPLLIMGCLLLLGSMCALINHSSNCCNMDFLKNV